MTSERMRVFPLFTKSFLGDLDHRLCPFYGLICPQTTSQTTINTNRMNKKLSLLFAVVLSLPIWIWGQITVEIKPVNWNNLPGVHSFAIGQANGKWLLIGGRVDGLHQRRPFDAFLATDNNTTIYVVDPATQQVWSTPLAPLSTPLEEQLQATNMQFEQRGDFLYIIGGYGYSASAGDHVTHDKLTAVNVPATIDAIVTNQSVAPHFRQISDPRFRVTGGYLDRLDQTFYLVGGQDFQGRYNPHGPSHGPGFFQEYTEEIRAFEILDNGSTLAIQQYVATKDSAHLHRRDYNMVPQIFPGGNSGFTVFSGVFQHTVDLPWLNTVDIDANGYVVNHNFNQYLSQYHCAHLPVYDSLANEMHTLFFGGMSQFTLDPQSGALVEDRDVPFVRTISRVTRMPNGTMDEFELPIEMPALLGAGAEFVPLYAAPYNGNDILRLNELSPTSTLVGYILGGIQSSGENIFFTNDGSQSWANTTLYEVWLSPLPTSLEPDREVYNQPVELNLFPNPVAGELSIEILSHVRGKVKVSLLDLRGKEIKMLFKERFSPGKQTLHWDSTAVTAGVYLIRIQAGNFSKTEKVIVR